jgi:hypothetical protein
MLLGDQEEIEKRSNRAAHVSREEIDRVEPEWVEAPDPCWPPDSSRRRPAGRPMLGDLFYRMASGHDVNLFWAEGGR